MTTILLAIGCAAIAACCFACAAMLQHDAVRSCGTGTSLGPRAFVRMIRTRRWLAGTALAVTGCGMHVAALAMSPLVIVQPIGVVSLVVTVLLAARTRRATVPPQVRRAVTGVCIGTGGFVVLAATSGTTSGTVQAAPVMLVVVGALAVTGTGLAIRGRARCLVLAAGSAVLFGTGSALVRSASLVIADAAWTGLGFALAALVVLLTGGWAQHQAYASGPPAVVVAATTVIDPFTAVAIGSVVHGEAAHLGPAAMTAQACFALLATMAVLALAHRVPDPHPAPAPGRPPADDAPRILVGAPLLLTTDCR